MKLLQAGAPKSGNFWLWKIVQEIYRHAGWRHRSFIQDHPIHALAQSWDLSYPEQADVDMIDVWDRGLQYRISSVFRMPIDDFDAYLAKTDHVWTHSPLSRRSFTIFPKFDKVIYIVRDPRDRAISDSRFAFTPYMQKYWPHGEPDQQTYLRNRLEALIEEWVRHVGDHLRHRTALNVHFVFYERLLHEFQDELRRLLDYLDLSFEPEVIEAIRRAVAFRTLKEENPDHVRRGTSGEWRERLSAEQKASVLSIAAPLMRTLRYPLHHKTDARHLPALPQIRVDEKHG